jgi:acetyltransferase
MLPSPSTEPGPVSIRPAAREDQPRIQALVRGLSPRSRYLRFFNGVQELAQPWLERFSRADPRGDFTLLATVREVGTIVGMAQYSADPYPSRADFALLVADRWQSIGIGRELLRTLLATARAAGLRRIECEVLSENRPMLELLQRAGFGVRRDPESALFYRGSMALAQAVPDFSCNAALAA